jgi:hypothetical protein
MRTPRQQSAFTGAAGQYAVASRLSLMNHTVYFPSVDEGVDIVLGNGLRLQVKCGRYHNDPRTSGRYHILAPGRVKRYHKGEHRDVRRSYAGVVDFVIYWAIEENRFFVFPAAKLTIGVWIPSKLDTFKQMGKNSLSVRLIREYEEAWNLLDVDGAVEQIEQQVAVETV